MPSTNWTDLSVNSTNFTASSVNSTDFDDIDDASFVALGSTTVTLGSTTILMSGKTSGTIYENNPTDWEAA